MGEMQLSASTVEHDKHDATHLGCHDQMQCHIQVFKDPVLEFVKKFSQIIQRARVGSSASLLPSPTASNSNPSLEQKACNGTLPHSITSRSPSKFSPLSVALGKDCSLDIDALIDSHLFWFSSLPVNIDIFQTSSFANKDSTPLLERWVVSYQGSTSNCLGNTSASFSHSHADTTNLILLAQSLYSHIRLMPLHATLASGDTLKSDLQCWYDPCSFIVMFISKCPQFLSLTTNTS